MAHFKEKVPMNWDEIPEDQKRITLDILMESPHYMGLTVAEQKMLVCHTYGLRKAKDC